MIRLVIFLLSIFFLFVFANFPIVSYAQTPTSGAVAEGAATLGVAHMVEMKDKNVKDGLLVSTSEKGAILTNIPYDSQIAGVVSRDAAIILSSTGSTTGVPVISTGTVYVYVSSREGNIIKGDLLTSSTIPGVATKANDAGYVLGTALEPYSNKDPKATEKIAVNLDLHYFNAKPSFPGTLSDLLKFVLLPTKVGPSPIYKYVVAALVVLGSMVLGFMTFGRAAAKGVEALGRNPSASRIIHLGIIFNVVIVAAIALAGLVVAFLILRL